MTRTSDTEERDEFLDLIKRRQEQHGRFLTMLEGVRWKFITAFGAGAGLALYFASASSNAADATTDNAALAAFLVIVICLAGVLTQIRISALMYVTWGRIRCLQKHELGFVHEKVRLSNDLRDSLIVPDESSRGNLLARLLSVHMASCFVLSSFIGIASAILLDDRGVAIPHAAGVGIAIAVYFGALLASHWYTNQLRSKPDQETLQT